MTRRTRLTLGALLVLALTVAGVASAATGLIASTPHYGTLASVGVSAGKATVTGRDLRLKLRLKHSIALRFAIVSGKEQIAWNGPAHLAPGVHTITRRLHGRPSGGSLRLRITSRKRSQRARGFIKVRIVAANTPPTGLALSSTSVPENQPAGTAVGTLSATDPTRNDRFTYALAGGPDDARFAVDGTTLRTTAAFDHEAQGSYAIRLRVTDRQGATFERAFTIAVEDRNDAPTGLGLSAASVPENRPSGTAVGTLSSVDQDAGDTPAFALVPGTGDTDNGAFTIDGTTLRTAAVFDFETKSAYAIRVRVSDGHGASFDLPLTITVTDVSEAPTGLSLSNADVAENRPGGTAVGTLSATGPGANYSYALATGSGDADNGAFAIDGTTLRTAAPFDFETKSSYAIRVRVSDAGGDGFEKPLTITVTNADDPPAGLALSNAAVAENQPSGTTVGSFGATDQDGDPLTYALVTGSGGGDNGSFTVAGDELRTGASFDAEAKGSYAIRVRVSDGNGGSQEQAFTVTVTNVNEPPQLTATSAALAYTEGDGAVAAEAGLGVSDPDSLELSGATVAITSNFDAAQDALAFTSGNGITGSYNSATGVLTLTGDAPVGAYRTALRSVTYANGSDQPSTPTRTISFQVTDTGALASTTATRDVAVSAVDDAPMLTTSSGSTSYTEGASATAIDGALTASDADDTHLEGATVSLSAGFEPGDELLFGDQNGITGSYDGATGVLTLSGDATVADYQTALRSIGYRNVTSDDPAASKTVRFVAGDGDVQSTAVTKAIAVAGVDDAPTVTTTAVTLPYSEAAGPVAADPGLTVSDPDSASLKGATVQITTNFAAAQDALAFTGQLGIAGAYDAATGTLTLTGDAPVADYQAALRAVTYENTSQNPAPPSRRITFQVTDAGDAASSPATRDVSLGAVNNAATVTTSSDALAYTEGAAATPFDDALTVSDPDDTHLEGARIAISAGLESGDELAFSSQNGISGSYNSSTGVLTLTGHAPLADYQTALRSIGFATTDDDPAAVKTIQVAADDGDGLGPASTRNVDVTGVDDAPVLAWSGSATSYTENAAPVAIIPALTLTDADSSQISGATVSITSGFSAAQDTLGFTAQNGITGSYNATTGVLTLSGTATIGDYQSALRSVTYANGSDNPSAATRTIGFQASNALSSNTVSRGVSVTPVNDAPTADGDSAGTDEDTTLNVAAPGVLGNDTDPDGDTLTVVALNGSSTLTGATTGGGSVTIHADGSYSYTPGPAFQSLSTGQDASDSFTYTVADAAAVNATATVDLTIHGVSDAPTATADSFDVVGNTALYASTTRPAGQAGKVATGSLLDNDTDPDSAHASLVAEPVTSAATTRGGTITIASDGSFSYVPKAGDTSVTDTFTYRVCDSSPCNSSTDANATGTVSFPIAGAVWYVSNSAAGNSGTSTAPFDTLAQAQTASAANDTIYVFAGDGSSTGYGSGIALKSGQRLLGERAQLKIGSDVLFDPTTARPALAASSGAVVTLDAGNTVRGVGATGSGTAGGIAGGSGDAGGTIDDVQIAGNGSAPGLDLNGTSGTWDVSDLTVSTSGATGVRLVNAGTVNFKRTGTISISSGLAKAFDASGTSLGTDSVIDSIHVINSPSGAVRLATTGTSTTTFGDLDLQTSGSSTGAFVLSSAGTVSVPSGGLDTISADGGPAVDVSSTSGSALAFDTVSSANSASTAINLDSLGTGTFSATGGTLAGFTGTAFRVNGGSGAISYAGTIGNGAGNSAAISGRTGGSVSVSGNITDSSDAGGGIAVTGNSGGSTTFSGATKTLDTGASDALVMGTSDGHTLTVSGGGLNIDTTSGKGVDATTSGTLNVTASGNTIDTTTGTALNVVNTDIGLGGLTFQSVSSNGAANGIVLDTTGVSGSLVLTSTGSGTCTAASQAGCTGGQIQHVTGSDSASAAPAGAAIVLKDTKAPTLTRMWLHDASNYAIRGSNVNGLTIANSVVNGTNGDNGTNDDSSVLLENLTGSASVMNSVFSGGFEDDFHVSNTSGSLDRISFSSDSFGAAGTGEANDALSLQSAASAGALKASVSNSTFARAAGDQVDFNHNGSGLGDLVLIGNTFTNNHPAISTGGGGLTLSNSGTAGATTMDIENNSIRDAVGPAVLIVKTTGGSSQTGTFAGNTIGAAGVANSGSLSGSGLKLQTVGGGADSWTVTSNHIRGYNNHGIEVLAGGGATAQGGAINTTITANTIAEPGTAAGSAGIPKNGVLLNIGTVPTDSFAACALISGNTLAGSGADASPAVNADYDIRLRQRQSTTLRLPGYDGATNDAAAVQTYVAGNNDVGASVFATETVPTGGGFTGGPATC